MSRFLAYFLLCNVTFNLDVCNLFSYLFFKKPRIFKESVINISLATFEMQNFMSSFVLVYLAAISHAYAKLLIRSVGILVHD